MPRVGTKKFAYTKSGKAAATKYAKRSGKKATTPRKSTKKSTKKK